MLIHLLSIKTPYFLPQLVEMEPEFRTIHHLNLSMIRFYRMQLIKSAKDRMYCGLQLIFSHSNRLRIAWLNHSNDYVRCILRVKSGLIRFFVQRPGPISGALGSRPEDCGPVSCQETDQGEGVD